MERRITSPPTSFGSRIDLVANSGAHEEIGISRPSAKASNTVASMEPNTDTNKKGGDGGGEGGSYGFG